MFSPSSYEQAKSTAANQVKSYMQNRFKNGKIFEKGLLDEVAAMVIRDKLVPPKKMNFLQTTKGPSVRYIDGGAEVVHTIHRHALNQLCSKVHFPMDYANLLLTKDTWGPDLFTDNLNTLFHNFDFPERGQGEVSFLHRLVGNELRGFLSRRFNRHLASLPLLRAFVSACHEVGAQPLGTIRTDTKFGLSCYLPFVFQPIPTEPNELIIIGVGWTNSDFGAGTLKINQVVCRPKTMTTAIIDETLSKVHLGSVIQESDIEMSEETMAKEIEAMASATRDAVIKQLEPAPVSKLLKAIALAHEEQIDWSRLKIQLSKFLYKSEVETLDKVMQNIKTEEIIDLPPVGTVNGKPIPSRWWASQAVAWISKKASDEERKLKLWREAGKFLSPS